MLNNSGEFNSQLALGRLNAPYAKTGCLKTTPRPPSSSFGMPPKNGMHSKNDKNYSLKAKTVLN